MGLPRKFRTPCWECFDKEHTILGTISGPPIYLNPRKGLVKLRVQVSKVASCLGGV